MLYEFIWVARWVAGRMHDIDWYDLDDVDAARARFEELAAAPPPAELDNACVGALARVEWLASSGHLAELVDGIAPDVVTVDHRSGVGRGFRIEGRDAFLENQIELRSSLGFSAPRLEWLAVRGGRHGLAKVTYVTDSGFEVEFLETYEIDADGRLCRSDLYDLDDLDTAVAALDERYVAGEGAEHADALPVLTMGTRCWPPGSTR